MKTTQRMTTILLLGCFIVGTFPAVTFARQDAPVTLYITVPEGVLTFDPQGTFFQPDAVENMFLGLTDIDPVTNTIVPELAMRWTVSNDGRVWTFFLRDDVPWVRWDPVRGEAEVLRMVTAADVEYALKRLCDPRLATYNNIKGVIKGCEAAMRIAPEAFTDADRDLIQVQALDDTTVAITLEAPSGFFLMLTPLWMFAPVPQEVIEAHGAEWFQLGNIVTNGAFMLDSLDPEMRYVLVRNPYLPADLHGPGNIERVVIMLKTTHVDAFALHETNQIEVTIVPTVEVEAVLRDPRYDDQRHVRQEYNVSYFGFTHDKPPFDNVHARRAFAAAVDRQGFVDQVVAGTQWSPGAPMIHFTPPGIFGAPPIDEPGVGFDPEYAAEQLALAGYPNCAGFPEIEIVVHQGVAGWGEYLVHSFNTILGCDPDRITLALAVDWPDLFAHIDIELPPDERADIWQLFWIPDYPDAHNFVGDVLSCEAGGSFMHLCNEIDDLIDQARAEPDPLVRAALYYDIEERFFGPEGDVPLIPLFINGTVRLTQPWYSGPFLNDGYIGGMHYDWYIIDQEAQLAARGG